MVNRIRIHFELKIELSFCLPCVMGRLYVPRTFQIVGKFVQNCANNSKLVGFPTDWSIRGAESGGGFHALASVEDLMENTRQAMKT